MTLVRPQLLFPALIALSVIAGIVALISGSADINAHQVWQSLAGTAPDNIRTLVIDLRLPRALTAFGVGGLLAVAGVLMQVLLRNPLAEPYILGTSGGAAVAALLAMMFGFGANIVDFAAFGGAMAATLLVFAIAQGSGSWTPTRLLLTGVVLAAGFSAATTLLLALTPDQNLRGMLFWLMGDLNYAYTPARSLWLLAVITAAGVIAARHLNVLARGDLQAAIVGLPVAGFRLIIFRGNRACDCYFGHNGRRNRFYRPCCATSDSHSVRQRSPHRFASIRARRRNIAGSRRYACKDLAGAASAPCGCAYRRAWRAVIPDFDEPFAPYRLIRRSFKDSGRAPQVLRHRPGNSQIQIHVHWLAQRYLTPFFDCRIHRGSGACREFQAEGRKQRVRLF